VESMYLQLILRLFNDSVPNTDIYSIELIWEDDESCK
jgi:hypothetical protein